MKTVAVVIARMNSSRLPGKVLMPLSGRPVLDWVAGKCIDASQVDDTWIATTVEPADDRIASWPGPQNGFSPFIDGIHRGSETDVLKRVRECADKARADIVVRVTGDCPFIDPSVIDMVVLALKRGRPSGIRYASNVSPPTWPDGLDVEAVCIDALRAADDEAVRPSDRDTVTQYIARNRSRWPAVNVPCPLHGLTRERWVLDTPEDYEFCKSVAPVLGRGGGWVNLLDFLDRNPDVRKINAMRSRNERFLAAAAADPCGERSYDRSQAMLCDTLRRQPY